jgi:putative nucleotidyltransferase with HDIG domain
MGLSEDQISGLRLAGLVHDIGKTRVPVEILTNPLKLSGAEFSIIKTHPLVGYDILKTIDFPQPIAKIVYQHHERMDGSGYPDGISGDDIMLEAKILAVADVVEAMSSHRPYRPAIGLDKALLEISEKKGILYDSKAVEACLEICSEKEFKFG